MTNTFNKQGLVDFVFHYNRKGVYRPALARATKISEFCHQNDMLGNLNVTG